MVKVVIPAAGRGIRLLPMTKEIPKEMMPIYTSFNNQKIVIPILQFIFEQLYRTHIRDYYFIVNREKISIEDHFNPNRKYLDELKGKQKELISNFYKKIEKSNIMWINQHKPLGFGDAIKKAKKYVGKSNFIIHAGDVSIIGKARHPVLRLIETAKKDPSVSGVLLCKRVKDTKRYGVPKVQKISNSLYHVEEVEEKPKKPKSDLAIMPLYFFKSEIFDCLKKISLGKNNEYQLTDAIQKLIESGGKVVAIPMDKTEIEIDKVFVGTIYSKVFFLKGLFIRSS